MKEEIEYLIDEINEIESKYLDKEQVLKRLKLILKRNKK